MRPGQRGEQFQASRNVEELGVRERVHRQFELGMPYRRLGGSWSDPASAEERREGMAESVNVERTPTFVLLGNPSRL